MTTFGTDFIGFDDLDANWTYDTNELHVLAYAVARRFITPPGGLFYDSSYGYDLRNLLSDTIEASSVEQSIEAEALKDERVTNCQAQLTQIDQVSWQVQIACTSSTGVAFYLTLSVNAVSVTLLEVGP